jgi:dUTP pyrophosphatase
VSTVEVLIQRLDDVPLPAYAHPGDAGADVVTTVDVELGRGSGRWSRPGSASPSSDGYVALVHPRSGLAARCGVSIVNSPGTVDAGYRGEVKVLLVNLDRHEPVILSRGDRIAQLVFQQSSARASSRSTGSRGPTEERAARLDRRFVAGVENQEVQS